MITVDLFLQFILDKIWAPSRSGISDLEYREFLYKHLNERNLEKLLRFVKREIRNRKEIGQSNMERFIFDQMDRAVLERTATDGLFALCKKGTRIYAEQYRRDHADGSKEFSSNDFSPEDCDELRRIFPSGNTLLPA